MFTTGLKNRSSLISVQLKCFINTVFSKGVLSVLSCDVNVGIPCATYI